jgi:hypothetical protein
MSYSFMNQRSLSLVSLLLLAASLPALLRAQETTGIEDERMQELAKHVDEQWIGPKNKATVGFRVLNSGGTVTFGNLGTVPAKFVPPASDGAVNRVYDDGYVLADRPRTDEVDSNGNQTSTPGGRYPIYANITNTDGTITKVQIGEGLGYEAGLSREWKLYSQYQLDARPGYVALTNYSTTSEGGSFSEESDMAAGVEMEYTRVFGRISRRIQWGVTTGITLNSISSKASGAVTSTLNSHTDYYGIHGTLGTVPVTGLGGPSGAPYYPPGATDPITPSGLETTVPLNQTPDSASTDNSVAGGATVNGRWDVKGAYFMMKLGPSLRIQFSDHWEMTASAGFAGAYAGTTYTVVETFSVATLPTALSAGVQDPQQSNETGFLTGYYADLTIEWAANERTGLFGGVTAQQLSSYEQKVGDRTALIDLGTAVGVRGGVSIKF